ncbi:LysR substrate-binding domain-containing protein [Aquamicrobium ahrensii]|uniref:DNA-binding transcriptional LysR family regulator n=1 Tax=Aquamicrobium ahrensii TaxID=469551 RepID=A0ABV2KT89_9HYPH
MNIRQIDAFRATYLMGSVSRAAEMLHISQPSVSRLVSDLERSVGFKLFDRTARGLVATEEGRRLYSSVERSFIGLREIRNAATAIRTLGSGDISLGVIPALAYSVSPLAAARMQKESSDLQLNVSVRTTQQIIEKIETHQFDLGLISPIHEPANVSTYYRTSTRYVCLLPNHHPMAAVEAPIDLMSLRDDDFVAFDSLYLSLISDNEVYQFIQSRARLSSHSSPVVAAMAEATGAVAIVDPFTANFVAHSEKIIIKPLLQDIRFQIAVVGRPTLSLVAQRFVTILASQISEWLASKDAQPAAL